MLDFVLMKMNRVCESLLCVRWLCGSNICLIIRMNRRSCCRMDVYVLVLNDIGINFICNIYNIEKY